MVQVTKYIIGLGLALLTLISCSDGQSLQRYYVDKQEDDNFMKIDIAASLLQTDSNNLTQEQKDILNTIRKVNVIAFPLADNRDEYDVEKTKVKEILSQEKYKTLMKMGSNNRGASLKYLGEEDAIDELIVFASDEERGFAVFRLIGNDMRPDQMIKLMNSIDNGDVDVSQFSGIGEIFKADIDYDTATKEDFGDFEINVEADTTESDDSESEEDDS